MATSWNYTDAANTKQISIPDIDYSEFARVSAKSGEAVMTNTTSPVDRPETVRAALQNIANIYAGTSIEPAYYSVSKAGRSLLLQVNDILTYTDDTDVSLRQDYPISAHMVVRFPTNVNVDATVILTVVERLIATAFATTKTDSSRLEALIRGSLEPTNIG